MIPNVEATAKPVEKAAGKDKELAQTLAFASCLFNAFRAMLPLPFDFREHPLPVLFRNARHRRFNLCVVDIDA